MSAFARFVDSVKKTVAESFDAPVGPGASAASSAGGTAAAGTAAGAAGAEPEDHSHHKAMLFLELSRGLKEVRPRPLLSLSLTHREKEGEGLVHQR